jgi:DNA-binding NarL/FixJ family response regulator
MESLTATGNENILIVDDEESVRKLLKITLEKNGYTCASAGSAAEARALCGAQAFDLILCDICMPEESGLSLCNFVRTAYPDTAVIMISGMDDMNAAFEALAMDIYGYIVKPMQANQLLISVKNAIIRRVLEKKGKNYQAHLEKVVMEKTGHLVESNIRLKKKETELETQTKDLQELNNALSIILKKRQEDKTQIEDNVLNNIKKTIFPYLEKLNNAHLSESQRDIVDIITNNLNEILSPLIKRLSVAHLGLTPNEIQVANFIKLGRTTKEIATALCLSENTIMTHRYNIRTKLGLKGEKQNLAAHLCALTE